ncbi:hypothetical protein TNCV_1298851 [Trichonephila clavipes]|nr:hypothetical protein TNCV_1298851 [Trichonephila clavipes]
MVFLKQKRKKSQRHFAKRNTFDDRLEKSWLLRYQPRDFVCFTNIGAENVSQRPRANLCDPNQHEFYTNAISVDDDGVEVVCNEQSSVQTSQVDLIALRWFLLKHAYKQRLQGVCSYPDRRSKISVSFLPRELNNDPLKVWCSYHDHCHASEKHFYLQQPSLIAR